MWNPRVIVLGVGAAGLGVGYYYDLIKSCPSDRKRRRHDEDDEYRRQKAQEGEYKLRQDLEKERGTFSGYPGSKTGGLNAKSNTKTNRRTSERDSCDETCRRQSERDSCDETCRRQSKRDSDETCREERDCGTRGYSCPIKGRCDYHEKTHRKLDGDDYVDLRRDGDERKEYEDSRGRRRHTKGPCDS